MSRRFRFADLLRLLGELGFDCATTRGGFRVCEHRPSETVIVLADRPDEEAVHEQTLVGVQLQLDKRGLLTREKFDRQVAELAELPDGNGKEHPREARARRIPGESV